MNVETKTAPSVIPAQYAFAPPDDEINLIDLWIALSDYRKHFLVVFLLCMLATMAYTFGLFKEKYAIESIIQIGTIAGDKGNLPIEQPESLISKINSSIVPVFSKQWLQSTGQDKPFDTAVKNPKGTNIVSISNKVPEDRLETYGSYQQQLVKLILADHQGLMSSLTANLKSQLEIQKLKLEELQAPITLDIKLKAKEFVLDEEKIKLKKLQDEKFFGIQKQEFQNSILSAEHDQAQLQYSAALYKDQLKRVEETRQILHRNIQELARQIKQSQASRVQAINGATEISAMPQLLIDNEIQQNQTRLLALEERYYVTSENQKSELLNKIEANRLKQIDGLKKIDVLKQKYEQLLSDNQIQQEKQKLAIGQASLAVEKVKLDHRNAVAKHRQQINRTETLLDNYNETRVVSTAVPSLKPVGMGRAPLIAISMILSAFVALMAVLMFMFSDRVKQKREDLGL